MLNKLSGKRELCYFVHIDSIEPIEGRDRVECANVGGWTVMVQKGQFYAGDIGIYFEVDSKVPETEPFLFLAKNHFKIKTQKFKTPSGHFYSQGLLMHPSDFGWKIEENVVIDDKGVSRLVDGDGKFLTDVLGVTYADPMDNKRKGKQNSPDKYQKMAKRMGKMFNLQPFRCLMKKEWGKKLLYLIYGRNHLDNSKSRDWPVGKFPGVTKTDQERIENEVWVLQNKIPFIVTEKCDGSSGTYILEKKRKNKFEFYVCSRNVRMLSEEQERYYGQRNYYWEVANKYNIEDKMKKWLNNHPDTTWVCWQGEICAQGIQGNPHGLEEAHLFCFSWTDSVRGRLDIREAENEWRKLGMEVVPIVQEQYVLPDDIQELKEQADGFYDPSVCENKTSQRREGLVYYSAEDPLFSFKNVSREYLAR